MIVARLGRCLGPGTLKKVRRGNGVPKWTLTWTDEHHRRRTLALSTDQRVAQMRMAEIIRKRDMALCGLAAVDGMNTPLASIRDAYLADLATRATEGHLGNTRAALARMLELLSAQRVRDLTGHDVLRARAVLLAEGLANRTANVHIRSLKAMLRWAVDAGLIAENPMAKVKHLPEGEGHQACVRRALSDDEIARFLAAAEADDRINDARGLVAERVPQAPFWRFLIESGCRYGEARTLSWGDVDLEQRAVVLRAKNTKARKARCVPLRREMAGILELLRERRQRATGRAPGAQEPVFLSPEGRPWCKPTNNAMRIFDRLLEAAGIERLDANGSKLDIHALRHTAASHLARNGVPLATLQRILGHSDPKLTSRHYTHIGLDDMRDTVDAMPAFGASGGPSRPRLVKDEAKPDTEASSGAPQSEASA